MATIGLTAIPGHLKDEGRGWHSVIVHIMGEQYERHPAVSVRNIDDIKIAVKSFGEYVQKEHPDASFYISLDVPRNSRKPNGYDAATRGNGVGAENWLKTLKASVP